jgi:ferredoxin
MSYRIIIDRSICDGYGACADIDPTDFTIGDDGIATAPDVARAPQGAREAARQCPMGAITVVVEPEVETR